ncbi:SpoVK ATPase of the AAA+ class [Pyrenophora tritici-repentis]|uniref:ATPase family associated protein n=2 Tax=Pyrenophora tritici-repentis TaxID=45151 RepID=A0A2W1HA53_9PLEO|nr:SpoVK ATPase AAA+ class [Pyrenophora tritici-repentis]KAG9376737.1 SpoVK ATPase AAA+ class [Pyrenophora tritici-repentis]KAI0578403.1 SpoVK ATPase AAA+ class [Pyrenophora tritici-repentis]KAI0585751.1 SpoVK ATPase AAA+ class [Pyrenophora tritici-repentis]KAI0611224.1 SpoVK ATPase AAA+ class [Pyrenophora tritici-repentis]
MGTPAETSVKSTPSLGGLKVEQHNSSHREPNHEDDSRKSAGYMDELVKRLVQIEEELNTLKTKRSIPSHLGPPAAPLALSASTLPVPKRAKAEIPKVCRILYKQICNVKRNVDDEVENSAIIVLYSEKEVLDCAGIDNKSAAYAHPWQYASPTRIIINSEKLAAILSSEAQWRLNPTYTTFRRPYKGLITYEAAIRDAYWRYTEQHEHQVIWTEQDSIIVRSEHTDVDVRDITGTRRGLYTDDGQDDDSKEDTEARFEKEFQQHLVHRALLRCLVEVLDQDMQSIFHLRQKIKEGSLPERGIAYEDLWHLYKPGDIVVSNPKINKTKQRVYRVLHVTGGRPLGEVHVEREGDPSSLRPYRSSVWEPGLNVVSPAVSPLILDCFYIDYDGINYGARDQAWIAYDYTGSKQVDSLELIPLSLMPDHSSLLDSLTDQGKRLVSLQASTSKIYRGFTIRETTAGIGNDRSSLIELTPLKEVDSEIILDHKAGIESLRKTYDYEASFGRGVIERPTDWEFAELFTDCKDPDCYRCNGISRDADFDINARSAFVRSTKLLGFTAKEELSTDHYALMTPRIYGYALQERRWHAFHVARIRDHDHSLRTLQNTTTAFNDLVLPKTHKTLLQALVSNQTKQLRSQSSTSPSQQPSTSKVGNDISIDLVRDKGKGVIILLHGVPGVGKTSTAECVAVQLGRPLFPITCGDLGLEPGVVEKRLEEYFSLASKWGCMLLLDEADVFLAKRSHDQLKRNSLVSVFLRVLEYYDGVLVLTTNRVGSFDEAFRSRIHISLYYPPLDEESTSQIWKMNLRRLQEAQDVDVDIDEAGIKKFYRKHWQVNEKKKSRRWNGRQIKNAFQTALALANWEFRNSKPGTMERPKLNATHFKKVAETSNHFDEYLTEVLTNGEDVDADIYALIAQREGLRVDRYHSSKGRRRDKRRDRDSDSSSSSESSSESDHYSRRKKSKEESKKSKSKAKKTRYSSSDVDQSDSEHKTDRSQHDSEKDRKKRKAVKKGKSRKDVRSDSDKDNTSSSD